MARETRDQAVRRAMRAELEAFVASRPKLCADAKAEADAARSACEQLYHVEIVRRHPKTGERIGDWFVQLTGYPMRRAKCMVLVGKWTPRRFRTYHTSWRIVEA